MHEQLQKLVRTLNAECGAVMGYNKRKDILYCMAEYNLPDKWKLLVNEADERSMNGKVYSSGSPIIKNNLLFQLKGHEVTSVLIVPIENDNKIIGTIEILNKNKGLFDARDRALAAETAMKIAAMM